jgi:hypothetical protein
MYLPSDTTLKQLLALIEVELHLSSGSLTAIVAPDGNPVGPIHAPLIEKIQTPAEIVSEATYTLAFSVLSKKSQSRRSPPVSMKPDLDPDVAELLRRIETLSGALEPHSEEDRDMLRALAMQVVTPQLGLAIRHDVELSYGEIIQEAERGVREKNKNSHFTTIAEADRAFGQSGALLKYRCARGASYNLVTYFLSSRNSGTAKQPRL